MTPTLTEKQITALKSISAGPALMPVIHFGKLRDMGLVGSAPNVVQKQRGYAAAYLTPRGLEAIAG